VKVGKEEGTQTAYVVKLKESGGGGDVFECEARAFYGRRSKRGGGKGRGGGRRGRK
jgi:hypothetical protein